MLQHCTGVHINIFMNDGDSLADDNTLVELS